jgi:hypothetical protein
MATAENDFFGRKRGYSDPSQPAAAELIRIGSGLTGICSDERQSAIEEGRGQRS